MKLPLRIALVLVGVLAITAIGTGSASASTLCMVNKSSCAAEDVVEKGIVMPAGSEGTSRFVFGSTEVSCGPTLSAKVTDVGGEEGGKAKPVKAEVTALSFGSCFGKPWGAPCSITAQNLPYNAEFTGSGGSGSFVMTGAPARFSVKCEFPTVINCVYSAGKMEMSFTGKELYATTSGFNISSLSAVEGSPCPAPSEWFTSSYSWLSPTSMYIVGGPAPTPIVRLCKVKTSPCPLPYFVFPNQKYPIGTALEGTLEGNSVFEFLYEGKAREPACEGGSLTGKTTEPAKPLIGEVSAMSFSKCGGGVCSVEAQSTPYKAEIESTGSGNGTLALVSGGAGSPKLEVNCGKAYKCVYKASSVSFTVTGGEPAKLVVSKTMEKDAASEAECGSTMTWKATYKLTEPTPLYVT
ncbi:MAG TPA: hypothetical protein VFR04_02795 [Solirubrobacterales bacterium]|nr:hypothetical protein [Solirubrobacterales bacterium]